MLTAIKITTRLDISLEKIGNELSQRNQFSFFEKFHGFSLNELLLASQAQLPLSPQLEIQLVNSVLVPAFKIQLPQCYIDLVRLVMGKKCTYCKFYP